MSDANKLAADRVKRHIPKYKRPAPKLPSLPDDRHSVERALVDDLLGGAGGMRGKHRAHKPVQQRHHQPRRRSLGNVKSSEDSSSGSSDLITQMASRLATLEKAQYMHRDEMVRKDREILKLKRKIQALESATEGSEAAVSEIENLRSENLSLKAQVHEMETFLNDYGLVWVGDLQKGSGGGKKPTSGAGAGAGSGDGAQSSTPRFTFDVTLLLDRVKQLNTAVGAGKHEVSKVAGVHRFTEKDSVRIVVYKDGILVKRGPFRPYSDKSAKVFIQDILDGYFPSEFKKSYPDGVVLDVVDKCEEEYGTTKFKPFSGKGAAVGDSNVRSLADVGGSDFQLRKQEFLDALPASVIKNGKVIPVKAGVATALEGDGKRSEAPDVVLVQTPVLEQLQEGKSGDSSHPRPPTPHDITTLRVKSASGRQTLVLKFRYDDTIADVRAGIDKHRTETTPYELRTPFPKQAFTDPTQTLRDAGLIPNATLVITDMDE